MIPGIQKREFTRIEGSIRRSVSGFVAIEEPLQIIVDGVPVAVLMRTPGQEKELAVGFCLSEGLIAHFSDIGLVQHCGSLGWGQEETGDPLDASRNIVTITTLRRELPERDARLDVVRLIRSGCGRAEAATLAATLTPIAGDFRVSQAFIAGLAQQVIAHQQAYREAGGVHAVAIFDRAGKLIVLGEDIGRHNAMDKAIGHCFLRGIPLGDKIAYSTGRASYEMVLKAVRVGLPIMISRSSPTTLAIDLGEQLNCTLIGYARGDRMHIYTHPERIMDGDASSS